MVYVCALLVTYIYNKIYYKDISKKGFEIFKVFSKVSNKKI